MKDEKALRKETAKRNADFSIPFLDGRPERDRVINEDDLLNLSISLHLSRTVDDFLNSL